MPVYSMCAFCGRNDSPRTREHVFADWIAREFPTIDWIRQDAATGEVASFKRSFGLVCRKVCKRCNTGWMRRLEEAAKPILQPLIHATKQGDITLEEQRTIARWFTKTIYAWDIVSARVREGVFSTDDRLALATNLFIRPDTSISIAQYRGTGGFLQAVESHMAELGPHLSAQQREIVADTEGYGNTVVIKHLALQFFTFNRGKNLIGKKLGFGLPLAWDRAAPQLCFRGQSISWPPLDYLDDSGLKSFIDRWSAVSIFVE